MTRSIILAAPAQQLTKLLAGVKRPMIYDDDHPVWEDIDRQRAMLEQKKIITEEPIPQASK